jgi:hypothetical protein
MRIQATMKVKRIEVKNVGSVQLTVIEGSERCWSKNRKRLQEKLSIPREEKRDGVYYVYHTLKTFSPVTFVKEGMLIDFCGTADEELWEKDGKLQRKFVVMNPDIKTLSAPETSQRSQQLASQSTVDEGGDDFPF